MLPRLSRCPFVLGLASLVAVSIAGGAEPLTLKQVTASLKQAREKIDSLQLRIRRVTTLAVKPEVIRTWPARPFVPENLGTDEILIAFQGDKRYCRVLELDYGPSLPVRPASETAKGVRRHFDDTKVWTGSELRQRTADLQSGKWEYRSMPGENARDCLPPPPYLRSVGLAMADPTASDMAHRNLQEMHSLAEWVARWPFAVTEKTEEIDGALCVVLEAKMECPLPVGGAEQSKGISDRLWLDVRRGLALRKRESRIAGQLVLVVNSDFQEVAPGLWLPKRSRTGTYAPADAPDEHRIQPVLIEEAKLCLWIVNRVPEGFFDIVLVPKPEPVCAFDYAPAYHLRFVEYHGTTLLNTVWNWGDPSIESADYARRAAKIEKVEEVWAVRGVGRRHEVRQGSKPPTLTIDTPRWRFRWVGENLVAASPSLLAPVHVEDIVRSGNSDVLFVHDRESVILSHEVQSGAFASEKAVLNGREVEKMTCYLPADPDKGGKFNIHGLNRAKLLHTSGRGFCSRVYFLDPRTHLVLGKQCGCKWKGDDFWTDYPAAESIARGLFRFQVPRDATLEIRDPELGRGIVSKGQKGPDLRQ
jgi:hypothetical protein